MRVMHVITGLGGGGAEQMLLKLVQHTAGKGISHSLIQLASGGELQSAVVSFLDAHLELGISPSLSSLAALPRASRFISQVKPDLICGWMIHGNVFATLSQLFARNNTPVVWGVRGTFMVQSITKTRTKFVERIAQLFCLAPPLRPEAIIYNSQRGKFQHREFGFSAREEYVIPNGFDTTLFSPNLEKAKALRTRLGIGSRTLVCGVVARFHPMKNHRLFFQSLAQVIGLGIDMVAVCSGVGMSPENPILLQWIKELGLQERVFLLGFNKRMEDIVPGFDIFVLPSSSGEGFPNAVGEAMACGVPCIVTDVGDAALLVDRAGVVITPGSMNTLRDALVKLAQLTPQERHRLGFIGRERIVSQYGLLSVVEQFQSTFSAILRSHEHRLTSSIS